MQERVKIFEDSIERVQAAFRNTGDEIQKLQDRAAKNRREMGERAQAQAQEIQDRLLEFGPIKAVEEFRAEISKQVESNLKEILSRIPIATQDDLKKLEKKVNAMSRKVRALEKSQKN